MKWNLKYKFLVSCLILLMAGMSILTKTSYTKSKNVIEGVASLILLQK